MQKLYQKDGVNLQVSRGTLKEISRFLLSCACVIISPMKHLAQTIKALSDPIRLRIVLLLQAEGELCVCDLMAVLGLPQSTVSRHLAYLKRSCWVDARRQGVWMHYTLSRKSCTICRELLQTLKRHAGSLPEAVSDRTVLAAFLKEKSASCP
jgi:ArsR family transcriptional regulator